MVLHASKADIGEKEQVHVSLRLVNMDMLIEVIDAGDALDARAYLVPFHRRVSVTVRQIIEYCAKRPCQDLREMQRQPSIDDANCLAFQVSFHPSSPCGLCASLGLFLCGLFPVVNHPCPPVGVNVGASRCPPLSLETSSSPHLLHGT